MARGIGKLSPAKVRTVAKPGIHGDGAGLWLHVGPTGGKSWLFRFMLDGRAREMGLGALHTIGLAEARERATAARRLLLDGIDPLDARNAARTAASWTPQAPSPSGTARQVHCRQQGRLAQREARSPVGFHARLYAYPTIGALPVSAVDTGHVTKVLEPIWSEKPETASRVRGRIEAVLDYAKVHGWRSGENPARWKGHIENVLPRRSKVRAVVHHAALPWREIGCVHGLAGRARRLSPPSHCGSPS